ncbi:uncharacterized protein VP01_15036g1 [Puccinia sorghi]|uniref:Uncharacterized protein n=1 Tax=Puccinia sorghi TaxID=27349 RepID=A0A0L6VJ14_9BASI|nr:uncharacterized protein VP01_15036g1 [Puccinia sorghi]
MGNIQFTSLRTMQAISLKAGQTIEGICNGRASTSSPTTNPNAMDLLAFQCGPHKHLSDAERTCQAQLNLYFCFSQAGHILWMLQQEQEVARSPAIFVFSLDF